MVEISSSRRLQVRRELFRQAGRVIPGGVNSPVRSFAAVGGTPVFVTRARGPKFYGECGEGFIDYCLSWGSLILGHAHPAVTERLEEAISRGTSFGTATKLETELAERIVDAVPSVEQVRLTSSGTEAVMGAIRLARAYTGKDKIIKFEGAYHGHADYLLAKAGSGAATLGIPGSAGVPADFTRHTILAPYNNLKEVENTMERYGPETAAIIVEPVAANCGVIVPESGFLEGLRKAADRFNAVLIFDEVITGFRLSYGGAQQYFGVEPDLTCLGKIVGGGLPIGAFGGKREIMELLAPLGEVYQAGTLSGNPITVTAGIATLDVLRQTAPYERLARETRRLCRGIKSLAEEYGIEAGVKYAGSMFSIFFTGRDVTDYGTARSQDTGLFNEFFHGLLEKGVYLSPSGFEANFLSVAHTRKEVEETLKAVEGVFSER